MVSLADAQCARAPRYHHGRSMRTVRSYLFHHRHSPPPATHSGAISENLTDSLVDFKLRELAVTPAPAQSEPADAPEELLDLSREFSDCSSFGSDISGELQRLASFARSEAPQGALSSEIAGFEALALSGLGSWSDIQESPSVEGVEPMVRACVECLGSALPEAKREAAARIRLLAKHRSDFRTLIGASGAIPALVPLLRCTDPAAQESAATALLNLSLEETNKGRIAAAGAIKPLVYALRTGTAVAKQNAACALLNLSMIEENRATIGACGAIPPLVALLVGGTSRGKKDALTTLYKLCSTRRNKERAVSAGAAAPLVGMVVEHGGGTAEKAMVVLGSLAAFPEGRDAIVEAGGIPALVETIEAGPSSGREFAVHALLLLCADSARNRELLVREGAIPPLVALSQCASARAKLKAETLLVYLREQRQDLARKALQNYPELLQEHSEKKKDILQLDQKQPSIAKVQIKYLKRKMERGRSAVSTAMTVGDKLPQSTVLSHALTAPLHMVVEEHYCRCSRQNLARSLSPFCLLCCRKLQCGPQ